MITYLNTVDKKHAHDCSPPMRPLMTTHHLLVHQTEVLLLLSWRRHKSHDHLQAPHCINITNMHLSPCPASRVYLYDFSIFIFKPDIATTVKYFAKTFYNVLVDIFTQKKTPRLLLNAWFWQHINVVVITRRAT